MNDKRTSALFEPLMQLQPAVRSVSQHTIGSDETARAVAGCAPVGSAAGVPAVAHPLRLDYMGLKTTQRRRTRWVEGDQAGRQNRHSFSYCRGR